MRADNTHAKRSNTILSLFWFRLSEAPDWLWKARRQDKTLVHYDIISAIHHLLKWLSGYLNWCPLLRSRVCLLTCSTIYASRVSVYVANYAYLLISLCNYRLLRTGPLSFSYASFSLSLQSSSSSSSSSCSFLPFISSLTFPFFFVFFLYFIDLFSFSSSSCSFLPFISSPISLFFLYFSDLSSFLHPFLKHCLSLFCPLILSSLVIVPSSF